MQDGVEHILRGNGVEYIREVRMGKRDRPDFMVQGDIALEVKIKGSVSALLRQIARYASHERVKAVVIVSTRRLHGDIPESLMGKPIVFVLARRFL